MKFLNTIDFIKDNEVFGIFIVIILCIAVIVLLSLVLHYSKKVSKVTVDQTLKVISKISYEANPDKKASNSVKETLNITIYNNNWRDIIISDFGFEYKGIFLSFVEEYARDNNLKKPGVIVPARNKITMKLDPLRLEKFIVDNNINGRVNFDIYDVAIDNVGFTIKEKNKALTKVLLTRQKARIRLAKKVLHDQELAQYLKEHDDQVPVKEHLYRLIHSKRITNQYLLTQANSFVGAKLQTNGKDELLYKDTNSGISKKVVLPEITSNNTNTTETFNDNYEINQELKITYFETSKKEENVEQDRVEEPALSKEVDKEDLVGIFSSVETLPTVSTTEKEIDKKPIQRKPRKKKEVNNQI